MPKSIIQTDANKWQTLIGMTNSGCFFAWNPDVNLNELDY